MLGILEIFEMAPKPNKPVESLKSDYGQVFQEIFHTAGSSQAEIAKALGLSPQAYGARIHGKRLPETGSRAVLCLALQALREKATDEERRGLVERGLKLMREIEEEEEKSEEV